MYPRHGGNGLPMFEATIFVFGLPMLSVLFLSLWLFLSNGHATPWHPQRNTKSFITSGANLFLFPVITFPVVEKIRSDALEVAEALRGT